MASKLRLKLFNTSGIQVDTEVESVYFETLNGQVGILSDHASYVSGLGTGMLEYKEQAESTRRCVVSEGFCEVNSNIVSILADSIDFPEKINMQSLESEKSEISAKLADKSLANSEAAILRRKLARVQACQKLLSN